MDDYISIAVRLARDPEWRQTVRQAVARAKSRAFEDVGYVRALETFMVDAVKSRCYCARCASVAMPA